MKLRLLLVALLSLVFLCAGLKTSVPALVERQDWGRYFKEAGVEGTLVLVQDSTGKTQVYDKARAATPYSPVSTFKILNSCIALETGVISGPDAVLPWDGVKYLFDAWNKDLTLKQAYSVSCVPVYQEIARRVGGLRMQEWVKAARYGNADIGGGIDLFWLTGELRISANEQIEFLRRLKHDQLPFSAKTMATVKDIMVVEQGKDWTLRGKTGLSLRIKPSIAFWDKPNIGWWVGWLERGGEVWYFALNIDLMANQAKVRQNIVKAVLTAENLLP